MAYSDIIKQYERRAREILALRARGWTLQRIADKYGITRQRIWKIING